MIASNDEYSHFVWHYTTYSLLQQDFELVNMTYTIILVTYSRITSSLKTYKKTTYLSLEASIAIYNHYAAEGDFDVRKAMMKLKNGIVMQQGRHTKHQ